MQVGQSLHYGPVGTNRFVVSLSQQYTHISHVHLCMYCYHLGTAVHVVHLQYHLERDRGGGGGVEREGGREGGRGRERERERELMVYTREEFISAKERDKEGEGKL